MKHNEREQFLSAPDRVIAILDGDQKNVKFVNGRLDVYMVPIESVEKALYEDKQTDANFPFAVERNNFTGAKDFYNYLQQAGIATQRQIFDYLMAKNEANLQELVGVLRAFLAPAA